MPLVDLCVAAALDAVKAGVALPWRTAETSNQSAPVITPSAIDASTGEAGAHVLVIENDLDAWGESSTMTDPASSTTESPPLSESSSADASSASPEPEATLERSPRVISLSNFEQALKEITPSSSESLGTLSELRKWNDEFGEGKREKRRNMWGKGSFGFIEKGEGSDQVKIASIGKHSS